MKKNRIYFGLLILALVVTIVWTSAGMLGVNKEEKKYSVSVIVNDSNNDRWIAMREGLEQAAKDDDIQLNYVSTGVFASEDEEKALIEREVENGADGIIVQLVSSEDTYAVFEKIDSSVAVMLLETDAVSEGVYSVTAPDNLWIGEALAQTVLQDYGDSLSEKKIGILSGNQNQLSMQQRLGSVKKLLTTAHRVYAPVGSDDAKSVIDSVQKTAPKAQVVPIFTRMTDWTEYTEDAVVNAVDATEAAIAVFGGDKTAKSYDGAGETTSRRSASSSRSSYDSDTEEDEEDDEEYDSNDSSSSDYDAEEDDSDSYSDEDE